MVRRFFEDRSGGVAIEYAVLAMIIGIGSIPLFPPLRDQLIAVFNSVSAAVASVK